jgi:hypothetical protein
MFFWLAVQAGLVRTHSSTGMSNVQRGGSAQSCLDYLAILEDLESLLAQPDYHLKRQTESEGLRWPASCHTVDHVSVSTLEQPGARDNRKEKAEQLVTWQLWQHERCRSSDCSLLFNSAPTWLWWLAQHGSLTCTAAVQLGEQQGPAPSKGA